MSLYRYAGKLLRLASGALAKACCCVKEYWCVPDGLYCDMLTYTCLPDPQPSQDKFGPYEENTCNYECPGPEECWPPVPYYCCYYSLDEYGQPVGGTYCQSGQCPSEALTASGPHRTAAECADKCRPHACVPTACPPCSVLDTNGTARCVPAEGGQYLTAAKCRESCGCNKKCTLVSCDADKGFWRYGTEPYGFCTKRFNGGAGVDPPYVVNGGATPAGGSSYVFWTDYERNKPLCVSYISFGGKPIRVQITAPRQACETYDGNTAETIKRDSGWRGLAGCDCPSSRPSGPLVGAPKGTLRWNTKQANVGWFHVRVFSPCAGSSWRISVGCDCPTIPEEPCCDCSQCAISWNVTDDDRVLHTTRRQGGCETAEFDGIYRTSESLGSGEDPYVKYPYEFEWKDGWPAAAGCRPSRWVRSRVQCFNSAMGPYRFSFGTASCTASNTFAAEKRYWRFFVCENGVMVNRTNDAVTAALFTDGVGRITVTNTIGGPAMALPMSLAGADPTGVPSDYGVSCPTAVDQIAPLDPAIVC
jgi:hypothetical protein